MDRDFNPPHSYQPHQYQPSNFEPGRPRIRRPVTDYGSTLATWMRYRKPRDKRTTLLEAERQSASYIVDMLPPLARPDRAVDSIPVKHLHSSLNKVKFPINVVLWTPEGRRLLTASSSGEFTLWNGMAFNFELIMQAHETAVRAATYSHSEDWLVSADQHGVVKYWQPNFNNVKEIQAHNEAIRGLAFAPTDSKFVTGGDDASLKIFDFAGGVEEATLTGHQWEVRCLDWHPNKGLLVSGSKDHSVKLWDPRTGRCLTTLSSSKNQVSRTVFEPSQGVLLATGGRDHIIRIFDLRMMRDVFQLRGHDTEVTSIAWHPQHRNLLSSGGQAGAIHHYLLDEPNLAPGAEMTLSPYDSPDPSHAPSQTIFPAHSIPFAHETTGPIWSLSWHPLGHIMASGSNDRITRFWSRARPGDSSYLTDRFHAGQQPNDERGWDRRDGRRQHRDLDETDAFDEGDGLVEQKVSGPNAAAPLPSAAPAALQLPGIALPGIPQPDQAPPPLPGFPNSAGGPMPHHPGGFPHPPPPPPAALQSLLATMDPSKIDISKLSEMFGGQFPPIPPPPGAHGAIPPPPLPPGFIPPPLPANAFPPPQQPPMMMDAQNGHAESGQSLRKRAPLPSQEEARKARKGKR